MRITEIAQIEVQDVLFPSGALREEISLRAAITKGCRQRCIYLSHAKAIDAIDQYLSYWGWAAPANDQRSEPLPRP